MPSSARTPPPDLRPLYHGPLADFVAARDALARRLRQGGDPRAAEVRVLRKPPLSAWAINQLFAREPQAMAALADAGERARRLQETAARRGDGQALRDLLRDIRAQAGRLTQRAAEILAAAAGKAPGEAIVERLRGSLDALAFDPATAPVTARGWLDDDLPPPGFEIMAPLQLAAAGPAPRGAQATRVPADRGSRAAPVAHLDDRRRAIAERRERERRERLERLRAELARAESETDERQAAAERATAAADEAARELEAARKRAAEAEARAEEARRRAADAQESLDRARAALAREDDAPAP